MTDTPPQDPASESTTSPTPPRRSRWQIGLRTFSLLIVAIAVWMTDIANRQENARIEAKIETMLPMARELVITDPAQIAVVKRQEYWYDENVWDLHLPPGQYRLSLATRKIDDKNTVIPPKFQSIPLKPGKHSLAFDLTKVDDKLWKATLSLDEKPALTIEEPLEWNDGSGSSGGSQISTSQQFPTDKPVVLFHRRFTHRNKNGSSSTPKEPSEGVMVWIEPLAKTTAVHGRMSDNRGKRGLAPGPKANLP